MFIKNFPLKNRSKITHSVCACNSILDCEGDTAWGDWICFSWIDARTSIIVSRIEDSICYRKNMNEKIKKKGDQETTKTAKLRGNNETRKKREKK